jgi:hypothetical protein
MSVRGQSLTDKSVFTPYQRRCLTFPGRVDTLFRDHLLGDQGVLHVAA